MTNTLYLPVFSLNIISAATFIPITKRYDTSGRAVCQIQYFQPRSNLVFNIGGTFFREIHSKKQHGRNIREFSGTRPHRTESHRKQNNKEKKLHLKMESIIRNTLFNLQFKTPDQIARRILSDRLRYDYFYSVSSFFPFEGTIMPHQKYRFGRNRNE